MKSIDICKGCQYLIGCSRPYKHKVEGEPYCFVAWNQTYMEMEK